MLSGCAVRSFMMSRWCWRPVLVVGMAVTAIAGCRAQSDEGRRRGEVTQMSSVRVTFTEGFEQDTVVIRVDGKQVRQHGPITTRHDVTPGLAWSADIPVDRDVIALDVAVPTKGATGSLRVNVKELPQVNVSVEGNSVVLRGSQLVPSIG